jgi:hypothetical protein
MMISIKAFSKILQPFARAEERVVFLGFGFRLRQGYGGRVVSPQSQGF